MVKNNFRIVGRLVDCDVKENVAKTSGRAYCSGNLTIESELNGVKNTFTVRLRSNQLKADGTENKFYRSYMEMNNKIGRRISVDGEFVEERYISRKTNEEVSYPTLSGRFVNDAINDPDAATWSYSGFVVFPLAEKKNKEGVVYNFDIELGQAGGYKGDTLNKVCFSVNPSSREIIAALKGFNAGASIELEGEMNCIVEQKTVTNERAGGFGRPSTTTFTQTTRNFYIYSGAVLDGEDVYPSEKINELVTTYKEKGVQLKEDYNNRQNGTPVTEEGDPRTAVTSLL